MKKTSKEYIMQALAGLVPAEEQKEVLTAVETFIENVRSELEKEYNSKLDEAYAVVAQEKEEVKKIGEQGYAEAYQVICELRDRLEVQREEFEHALGEGFEEAYQMLAEQRQKTENLEMEMYEDYDQRLQKVTEFYVEQIDKFFNEKGEEFYESVKRDVMSDPITAEHKVVLDKIMEVTSNYMTDEDRHFATSSKVEALSRQLEDVKGQQRILEAKNFRLASENNRLNENVRQQADLLTEATRQDQNERRKKARTVEGRGKRVVDNDRVEVISEHRANAAATSEDDDDGVQLTESVEGQLAHWQKLAGITK